MANQPKHIFFFANGNTAVFGDDDQQITDLQRSWLLLYIEFLQENGVKVEEIEEIQLPNGRQAEYLKDCHNWRIKPE